MSRLSQRQRKRMARIVADFQKYVATYSEQPGYQDYADHTFIEDMLYGIGLAIDKGSFHGALGYCNWLNELRQYVVPESRDAERGNAAP